MNFPRPSRCITPLLLCSLMLAAGCGMMPESKKIEYKSEGKKTRPLEVPPDLVTPSSDGRYAMPVEPGSRTAATTYSAYTGERKEQVVQGNIAVLPKVGEMRIERSGSERWLVVPGVPPDKLWDQVKEFWQENGMLLSIEMPQAGIMETEWNENRAKIPQDGLRKLLGRVLDSVYSTSERDKYRTRLEKGTDGSTEVYISHRGMSEVYISESQTDTRWQPRPPDPELEAEMLRRLMLRLGPEEDKSKVTPTEVVKQDKAKLNRSGPSGTTLEVSESFDRAWRRVGLALDRIGFTVEDRDRSQGVYYVRYVDPDADAKSKKSSGWFSGLWSSSDKKLDKNSQFRIHVKGSGEASTVQVLTKEGGVDAGDTSSKILGLLYEQLR